MIYKVEISKSRPFPIINVPTYIDGEILWSYVSRLAIANGTFNTLRFLQLISSSRSNKNWKTYSDWPYSLNKAPFDDFLNIAGTDSIILETTLYPYMLPFRSRINQAEYVRNYVVDIPKDYSSIVSPQSSIIKNLRLCPKCLEKDLEHGVIYYHKLHQFPGLRVCPIHGCSLKEYHGKKGNEFIDDNFVILDSSDEDQAIAQFCLELMDNPIDCSADDTITALRTRLYEKYEVSSYGELKKVLEIDDWFIKHEKILKNALLMLRKKHSEILDFRTTAMLIIHLFRSWNIFRKTIIPTCTPIESFSSSLRNEYSLISTYRNSLIKVKCNKCNHVFSTTPYSLEAGLGCPVCCRLLTQEELFMSMFNKASKGKYKLKTDFKTLGSYKIQIEDINTGIDYRVMPRYFVFYGEIGLPATKTLTIDALRHEVENTGNFELIEVKGEGKRSMLHIRSIECKHDFWISRSAFLRKQFCRICNLGKFTDLPNYDQIIKDRSEGIFHWTGNITKKIFAASNGDLEIKSNSWLNLLNRLDFIIKSDGNRRNLQPLKEGLEAFYQENRNKVFFLEDMLFPYESKAISRMVSLHNKQGKIFRFSKGIYYNPGEKHPIEEVLFVKYFNRYGKLKGIPIGNTLLEYIRTGKIECTNPEFVIYDNNEHKVRNLSHNIGNTIIKIHFTKTAISFENWETVALLETIECLNSPDKEKEIDFQTLREWIISRHIEIRISDYPDYSNRTYQVWEELQKRSEEI